MEDLEATIQTPKDLGPRPHITFYYRRSRSLEGINKIRQMAHKLVPWPSTVYPNEAEDFPDALEAIDVALKGLV